MPTAPEDPAIDAEVAAFAASLEGLAVIDHSQVAADVRELVAGFLAAPDHGWATVVVREHWDAHAQDKAYAAAVLLGALTALGQHIALSATSPKLVGDSGLLQRFYRVSFAARAVGLLDVMAGR